MALECVCMVTQRRGQPQQRTNQPYTNTKQAKTLQDIDLCEVVKRSQDESSKHNDLECHSRGEKRQNLINKLKMYLDDYDDRPVMKGKGKSSDEGKALGQSGFGPMIKYPGYVDYDHPYFSDPYNKLPTLATTVGQRGENPCLPIQVRDWDSYNVQAADHSSPHGARGGEAHQGSKGQDGRCHCAERRGEVPTCPAAGTQYTTPAVEQHKDMMNTPHSQYQPPHTQPTTQYICIPLPDGS